MMMILKEEKWLKDLQGDVFRCITNNSGGTVENTLVAAMIKLNLIFHAIYFCGGYKFILFLSSGLTVGNKRLRIHYYKYSTGLLLPPSMARSMM